MTENWAVEYRPGGWARARAARVTVYLRIALDEAERLRIRLATMTADEPITEAMWRSVPLSELEMNLAVLSGVTDPAIDRMLDAIRQPVEISGFSVESLERYFNETEPLPVRNFIPGKMTVDGTPLRDRFKLTKPADGRLSDEFLRNAAGIYMAAIEGKQAPAPMIAAAAGVPVRTVHGWITEARRRGILPPAVRGKAG